MYTVLEETKAIQRSINCVGISKDRNYIAICTDKEVNIYTSDELKLNLVVPIKNCKLVEVYEKYEIILVVGSGEEPKDSPRILTAWSTAENQIICEIAFLDTILAVKANLIRLVVCLAQQICVYDTSSMKVVAVIQTCMNESGLIALAAGECYNFLLYPASETKGDVQIYDCFTSSPRMLIESHKSPLFFISISSQGHLFATSSHKGTIIRIFSLPSGEKIYSLRRGNLQVEIYNSMFSSDSTAFLLASNSGTIHVFDLSGRSSGNWKVGIKNSLVSATSFLLPNTIHDNLSSCSSVIKVHTGYQDKFVCTFLKNSLKCLSISYQGTYNLYDFSSFSSNSSTPFKSGSFFHIPN
ncbi:hypothetical protein SteCoe_9471 [Stentor coeruleus]|uniref:Anaphase-promoting complex subunit 4 WD40 domain-containing protein n=1 Tax=Stentor coeruleus TaxID=5963 RepID=A0A1R2CI25_9CILI|nr:hypothetical protein SteCoe_9471 [Stentor coeruleus]